MQERTRARDSAAAAAAAGGGKVPPPPPPRPPPPPPRRPTSGPGSSSSGGGEVVGSSDDVETATADGAPPVTSSGEGEGEEGDEEGEGEEDLGVHGDAQMGFMHRQPLARGGMAATLGLLAATGDLGAKRGYNVEQQVILTCSGLLDQRLSPNPVCVSHLHRLIWIDPPRCLCGSST